MQRCIVLFFAVLFLTLSLASEASVRQEVLPGPVAGDVVKVLDGDTLAVRARVWIGTAVETSVRIEGIDAPEIKGKCEKETALAEAARREILRLVGERPVEIYDIRLEKYAGRVLARVRTADGIDIGQHMINKGLVRPYHGEKRQPWCAAI